MKLAFDSFVTEKTVKPLIKERLSLYDKKAIKFLRQEFAPSVSLLNDEELHLVVKLAYKSARNRGIKTETEHLKYLIPVMFWGSYFELDPQYTDLLLKAGWLDKYGNFKKISHVTPLLDEVDQWFSATQSDLNSPGRFFEILSDLYKEPRKDVSIPFLLTQLELLWPARFFYMNKERRQYYAETSYGKAKKYNLDGNDLITYSCLGMFFGYRFGNDPRYPWSKKVFANKKLTAAEKRTQLGNGALDYWNSLLGV